MQSSCAVASTSGRAPAPVVPSSRRVCRQRTVEVQANDGFCRDKVALRKDVKSQGKSFKVTFLAAQGAAKVVEVPDDEYILDAAERAGLDLPNTCRGGICGACVARVSTGKVDQSDIPDLTFTLSEEEQAKGMALLCMARAESDLTIETQCDWGYSLGVGDWKGASGLFQNAPDPLMGTEWNKEMKEAAGVQAVKAGSQ